MFLVVESAIVYNNASLSDLREKQYLPLRWSLSSIKLKFSSKEVIWNSQKLEVLVNYIIFDH